MTTTAWDLVEQAHTVLVLHAHPDDESLSTGALLRWLSDTGTRVVLVTATRGEEGEVVPGSIPTDEQRPLEQVRAEEIDAACAHLGIAERHMLGTPPAYAADTAAPAPATPSATDAPAPDAPAPDRAPSAPAAPPRVYRDSGMRWLREGLAGPSESAGPSSFTRRPLEEAVTDLVALIEHVQPQVLLSYDDAGSYGHPDHVHAHHVSVAAAARTDLPLVQFASDMDDPAFAWRDLPGTADAVEAALRCYRTQLTVRGRDGERVLIRHVGGQDDVIEMRAGLTR